MKWIPVATMSTLVPGIPQLFKSGGLEIGIFLLTDGRVLAVDNRCPHKGGPLSEGIVSDKTVFCPLHNWRIDLESGEAVEPNKGSIKVYPVKVEEEKVWIALDEGNR